MSIYILVDNVVCGELIILLLGGKCSFYMQTPENKGFKIKNR